MDLEKSTPQKKSWNCLSVDPISELCSATGHECIGDQRRKICSLSSARPFQLANQGRRPGQGKNWRERCLSTGLRVIQAVGSEQALGGIPWFVAYQISEDGKVVGCILTAQMIASPRKVNNIAHSLAASSEEMTAGMQELSSSASTL